MIRCVRSSTSSSATGRNTDRGFEMVEAMRPVPAGVVTKVEPFGLGQLVYINGEARPFYANYLQLDEEDESALAACEIKQVKQGGRI